VDCRLIVYDHGLLLKLLYKFVPHTHTSCVLEKRRAMAREREKACEKSAAARGHFASIYNLSTYTHVLLEPPLVSASGARSLKRSSSQ
jgi:hypothetical protein